MKEIHTTPRALHRRLKRRNRTARRIRHALRNERIWPAIVKHISAMLYEAERDPAAFQNKCGEPMPPHLLRAVRLEITLWIRLRNSIEQTIRKETNEAERKRLLPTLKECTKAIQETLAIQRDILRSPLIRTHMKRLQAIARRLQRRT